MNSQGEVRDTGSLDSLKAAAHDAPRLPGVYLWKDEEGRIIYIGKAKSLRDRLSSYFSGEKDAKTAILVRRATSIETIIVASEYEALLLENTLIKQHSPRYNIDLKDGKTYPVIRITSEEFPRIFRTRRIIEDHSLYYGPFPNVQNVDAMLELIDKLFPLRKCKTIRSSLRKRRDPCMYYHIGRCMAPCCGKIGAEEYRRHVERVQRLLSGETEPLIIELTGRMHEAARALQFEWAARIRNAIRAIEDLIGEDSAVVDFDPEGRDYIAWAAEGVLATFTVFSMRGGKMTGRELYRTRSAADEGESLELFITTYYDPTRPPPPKIYLQPETSGGAANSSITSNGVTNNGAVIGNDSLMNWFKTQWGHEPEFIQPEEKHHTAILAMARQNALEDIRKRLKERGAGPALDELARALNLPGRPERIEGFDIAQLDGKHPVASLVSFKNGIPDKKNYRYFKLRSVIGIVDDFAAMREAVHRRYSRLIREGTEIPDLVLIDGGIGQVNAAKGVMDELGMNCGVVGLAKRDEELWLPHTQQPLILSRRSEALKVLQFVRDETHRFATGLNQRLRSKDLFFPVLESVDGIGKHRAAAIMKAYENIENIAAVDPAELAERCRVGQSAAKAVRAAARLALENRNSRQQQFTAGRGRRSGTNLAESLAAEAAETEYEGE
ncbi:MAG: excinuclease ABC subunit UvrC [Treponema sp.]|jgi:excinuclease ABC subunit C|nr:excinuclease ABC subunit UvrC [Treponema sp.]